MASMRNGRAVGMAAGVLTLLLGGALPSVAETPRVIEMSAVAATAPPRVALPAGRVVTVAFHDAGGAPWPAVEIVSPASDWLSVRRAVEHPHVVFVESRGKRGSGNLVALLEGLASPVHLALVPDAAAVATRVEVRLTDARAGTASGASGPQDDAAVPGADLDAAIRDYLLSHPEVLREALDPARQLASRVESHRAELLDAEGVPFLGDASGAVTVVEFFDYRCGFCKRSLDAVRAALALAGVRLQMREYPILGEDSLRAARAALAAARQGAYEAAHFALMAHEGAYDAAAIEAVAAQLDLDIERLRADMASPAVDALIEANRALAQRLGVTGTPAFLVVGPGGVEVSPGALDAERLTGLIAAAG